MMTKYEDCAIAYYGADDYNMRVYTHPNNELLKAKTDQTEKEAKNPMRDAYIWLKGEHSDLVNMLECLKGREMVMDH